MEDAATHLPAFADIVENALRHVVATGEPHAIFEDDVVLREDFGEKLLWSFQEMQKGRVDWDVFLLNW